LKKLAGAAVGCSLSSRAFGQNESVPITATKLSDSLVEITGAGSNVMVMIGSDGLAMVDGGLPDRSTDLLKVVASQSPDHLVKVLFNTHWHLDHTGSNEALGKAGAKIIAHLNTKRWLSSQVLVEAQNRTYQPRPAEAIPNETITSPGTVTFGKQKIEYGPLPPAHTNGDIYVFSRSRTS
jgi:glyoxylase-like metal-dependent hydrolase (beta-lactamase superfamily II)